MLLEANGSWAVKCSKCELVAPLPATTLEEARKAATEAGWMDQARRGVVVARWKWLCPSCRPVGGGGMGATTPG